MIHLSNNNVSIIADMLESYAVALDLIYAPPIQKINERRVAINLKKKLIRMLEKESPHRYKRKKKIHEQFKKL